MVESRQTPTCEVSGLPLPVLPLEPRQFGALLMSGQANEHHHFHPERSPDLRDLGGFALRKSRIQLTPLIAHNEYHRYYDGPPLPDNEQDMFRLVVLSATGIVPRRAIDPRSPDTTVGLSNSLHRQITASTRVEQPREVAKFLAHYCATQETDTRLIDELMHENATQGDRLYIARELLGFSIETALAGIGDQHQDIKKERLIVPRHVQTPYSITRRLIRRHALNEFANHLVAQHTTA